ncbi:hypothetical protein VSR69_07170 [Paraburkholderia phytofirmans]|jgi:hypothetical protein|nr:hypothetical protein [Paraburkholderia sp. BL9I2N2]
MPTPEEMQVAQRGGFADAIHVAGGGPMNGGAFQTSVHEELIS